MAIPIVDLKRSVLDEKESDPKKGQYTFKKKVYYRNQDFKEGYIHPFKLKWCKYSENDHPRPFSSFIEWKMKYKATPVVVGDDYWPEGYIPDTEGKYVHIDLVLVKIPIEEHMKHKREAAYRAKMNEKNVAKEFKSKLKNIGAEVQDEYLPEEIRGLGT